MTLQFLPVELFSIIISFNPFVLLHKLMLLNKNIYSNIDSKYNDYFFFLMNTLAISKKTMIDKNTNEKIINSITTIKFTDVSLCQNINLLLFKNLTTIIFEIHDCSSSSFLSSKTKYFYNSNIFEELRILSGGKNFSTPSIQYFLASVNIIKKNICSLLRFSNQNNIKYDIWIPNQIKNITIIGSKKLSLKCKFNEKHIFEKVKIKNIRLFPLNIATKHLIFDEIEIAEYYHNSFKVNTKKIDNYKNTIIEVHIRNNDDHIFVSNIGTYADILKIIMHENKVYVFCVQYLINNLSSIMKKIIIVNHGFDEETINNSFSDYTNVFFE